MTPHYDDAHTDGAIRVAAALTRPGTAVAVRLRLRKSAEWQSCVDAWLVSARNRGLVRFDGVVWHAGGRVECGQ